MLAEVNPGQVANLAFLMACFEGVCDRAVTCLVEELDEIRVVGGLDDVVHGSRG